MPQSGNNAEALAAVVGVVLLAVIVAFILAPALGQMNAGESQTYTQSEGETVYPDEYGGTIDNVSMLSNEVTVTVRDNETGDSSTITLAEGENATLTIDGHDVTVTHVEYIDDTTARIRYEHEHTYGWEDGPKSLWGILDLLMVIVVVILSLGWILAAFKSS